MSMGEGRIPRHAGEQGDDETHHQLSALEERVDPTTIFAERMALRYEAKKAYVHRDASSRVAKAMLRKAAPKPGRYQVGDLVSFQRQQNSKGINRRRWSPASRIIGFEGAGNQVGWVVCEGVPVCIAMDQVIPASDAQTLAYRYLHERHETIPEQQQQSFIDRRQPLEEVVRTEEDEDSYDEEEWLERQEEHAAAEEEEKEEEEERKEEDTKQ